MRVRKRQLPCARADLRRLCQSASTAAIDAIVAVPEPSTLALAGLGGFGMWVALRRKKT